MTSSTFLKVKLGAFKGTPAVVLTDHTGKPFLWCVGSDHLAAIRRMRSFCDEQEQDQKAGRG